MIAEPTSIFHAGSNTTSPDWRWDSRLNRWHGWLLWYVSAGEGTIVFPHAGGGRYTIGGGDCFVFAMDEGHIGTATAPLDVHAVGFRIDGPGPLWPHQRRHRRVRKARLLQEVIDSCVEAHGNGDQAQAHHWLLSALMIVAEEDARPRLAGIALTQAAAIDGLATAMRADPARHWTSIDVTNALGVSREHAIRLFTRHQGMSPTRWVITCRMDRARYLLRFSSTRIRQIAAEVGYADPYHFTRVFTRHCGRSPSAWRAAPWSEDEGNLR